MKRRPHWSILVSLGLVPLIAVLATLQYRWVGEVSAAEATRKQAFLDSVTSTLTAALTLEVDATAGGLQPPPDVLASRDWARYAAQLDEAGRAARLPHLVKRVYLVEPGGAAGETVTLWRDAARGFTAPGVGEQMPEGMEMSAPGVRAREDRLFLGIPQDMLFLSGGGSAPATPPLRVTSAHVVVELDVDVLVNELLPGIVSRHFGDALAEYVVGAVSPTGRRYLYYRSDPLRAPDTPDVVTPLFQPRYNTFGALALNPLEGSLSETTWVDGSLAIRVFSRQGSAGRAAGVDPGTYVLRTGSDEQWLLVVSHRSGSLAEAARGMRTRNLAVSFGILVVLAAGIVLLTQAVGRTRELARRERELVATVSHELKTPLGVILAVGQNLEAGIVTGGERAREYGATIGSEGGRLRSMIEKILTSARLGSLASVTKPAPIDPDEVTDRTIARILPDAVRTRLGRACRVDCDASSLASIVENLAVNAKLHGVPAGGPVTVVSERGRRGRGEVWLLAIQDRGPGLSAADRRRLFEPFARGERATREQVPGTGLGLHIARSLARDAGGDLVYGRVREGGSRFRLTLPVARG